MLVLKGVNTFYGKAQILFNMSLDMSQGEVAVLLGRNGVGKSTTFKSIIGLVVPKTGEIRFKGQSIRGLPPYKICALGLGYVPEDRRIFTGLTVMENLEVGRRPPRSGFEPWTPERLFELFPNLGALKTHLGGQISGGEQQMLTIARTLMGNPEMIILDEPSEGLAPVIVDQLANTIKRLKQNGVTVLLAEQNLNFARRICDRAFIVDHGRVCHESTMKELTDEVCEMYLAV
ncbi:MAG: ABC transporter ATP-binding protein [Deltaproteobacteria bacterium]|nr:ABC transporter ATP-binding protein [Deltaproteobacteria bacterium]MBW1929401.1 ABC transporter ATP-binding protein [Deltaproteobacteria bacterium]MBW2025555.1 ABC transporter ATP-binding protein [Deltaproteobacteria bacterium]MBW2126716.1 ABC transporter ATP-binding protein [Deltaproteobacteria bacterium]RLB21763.1 MAG: ABC transporter ATP-binding protein [Deltaproteobacteria bacterium]